jgi:hypothetical protein
MMRLQLEKTCEEHGAECPDILIGKFKDGTFYIPIHDHGASGIEIYYCPWCGTKIEPAQETQTSLKIVRLFDMMDGWIDITGPVSEEEAQKIWNEKTKNGTQKTTYEDGDYYKVFPADTKMVVTPEFLGR